MGRRRASATTGRLVLVHALVLLVGLMVIFLVAAPVRFRGWSLMGYSWPLLAGVAMSWGALVGTAEGLVRGLLRRPFGGYAVLAVGSLPGLWLPLLTATLDSRIDGPFSSGSDVVAAGVQWALFWVAASVAALLISALRRVGPGSPGGQVLRAQP